MKPSRILRSRLVFGLAVLALLCGVAPRVFAHASAPQAISAVDVATSWVFALKRSDTRILERTTVFPFELRIENAPCNCDDGKARDSAQLTLLLGELMKSPAVQGLEVTSSDAKEIAKGSLPKWTKRWSKRLPRGARLVLIEASGDDGVHALTFVLVVTGNRVRAVWLDVADGDA